MNPVPPVWFRGVRSSKFRHIYGEPMKRDKCYDNVKITKNAHDSQFCAVNPKFVAIVTEVAGGGAFLVIPINSTGRLDFNTYKVTGHRGPVLDIKWNPFDDNVIASCSDDCTIKVWHIPDEGLKVHLNEWLMELVGHKRRVGYIEWHPTAENILFSSSFDHLVIVWNIQRGEAVNIIDCHPDAIFSMSLNRDGSLLATTCKDKKLRVIEPRTGIVKAEGVCHLGSKASKVVYLGDSGLLVTTGFSRHSDRQYCIWNENDLNSPLKTDTIDSSSGVIFPFFDPDTNVLFLAGKGDGNIRYYEFVKDYPYIHFLSQFISGNPQRGFGIMPKRGLNTFQCEIYRFYKLHTAKDVCEPISMIVPRKSDQFHDDLYPDTVSMRPALTAKEWIGGRNSMPILMSMKTGANIRPLLPTQARVIKSSHVVPSQENNKKKFAFLSTETIPDYRTNDQKCAKTNQNTKFQQLQQNFFNSIDSNNKTKDKDNDFLDTINYSELKKAFKHQAEELRNVKKQLVNAELRVKEMEAQIQQLSKT